ncbi:MAG: hypothetical protein ACLPYS_01380 [Vulcanimicrobiaceae bacterium]
MAERPNFESVPRGMRRALGSLVWTERAIFLVTGLLLFAGALALLKRSVELLVPMFTGDNGPALAYASSGILEGESPGARVRPTPVDTYSRWDKCPWF